METFTIKDYWTEQVLHAIEAETLADAVAQVVANRGSLRDADLRNANLRRARLDGARLDGARLDGARLDGASLVGASLDGASLDGARLDGARLDGASLVGASLDSAVLTPIRDDLWAVLSAAPSEVEALRAAVAEGRIDGTVYQGECACLVGTIANVRGVDYNNIPLLKPNSSRPIECFFLGIRKGDRPETNQVSRLVLGWIDTWLESMRAAFAPVVQAAPVDNAAPASRVW